MKKTIRIIDLLNDLFDYRETMSYKLPKKIKFNNIEFKFKDMSYYSEDGNNIMSYIDHTLDLRVQAEILDEEEFEDIEEKSVYMNFSCNYWKQAQIDELANTLTRYELAIKKIIRNQKKIIEKLNKNNSIQ